MIAAIINILFILNIIKYNNNTITGTSKPGN